MPFVVSAPGKVILFGEHAVVYGKTAVAASLGLKTYGYFAENKNAEVRLKLPDVDVDKTWSIETLSKLRQNFPPSTNKMAMTEHDKSVLERLMESTKHGNASQAVLAFLYLYFRIFSDCPAIEICVRSTLPVGAGLGSSASYSVCLSGGLLLLSNQIPKISKDEMSLINEWAFIAEKVIHGNPSGVDNSVSTFGGAVLYSKGKMEPLDGFTSLKFLLINTNVPKDTKKQVSNVRLRHGELPRIMDSIFDAIQGISDECKDAFVKKSGLELEKQVEVLIDMNHNLLDSIGVGHPSLDLVRSITRKHGLVSKLTGAGGGGCALTLIKSDTTEFQVESAEKDLKDAGFTTFVTSVGGNGLETFDFQGDIQSFMNNPFAKDE